MDFGLCGIRENAAKTSSELWIGANAAAGKSGINWITAGWRAGRPWFQSKLKRNGNYMLWTVVVILAALWLLGLVSSYTMGGFLHLLLAVAVMVALLNLTSGRRRV